MSSHHHEEHNASDNGKDTHKEASKEGAEGGHHPEVKSEVHHTSDRVGRIALGRLGDKELTAAQSVKELGTTFVHMAMNIVDLGKDTVSHFKNAGKDIVSTPGIIGKTAFSLASLFKVPLETSMSIIEMFVKQGINIGDTIASLTAWKKIPTPLVNTLRALPAAIGWIFSPFGTSKQQKEAHVHH